MSLLAFRRAVALAFALLGCAARFAILRLRRRVTPEQRALWLQRACRDVLASFGIRSTVAGPIPERGLIVSNHLSYLDVVIYASLVPCAFVSKEDVRDWPYFGAAARAAGTIFLNRSSHRSALRAAAAMTARLTGTVPVLLFPEGTSSDGAEVLRFHSTLFEPAIRSGAHVTPASIRYATENGVPERALCWFGDEGFLPHLVRTLGTPCIRAEVVFGPPAVYSDRREAARAAHALVSRMRTGEAHAPLPEPSAALPV